MGHEPTLHARTPGGPARRRRVLVVNAYFDHHRRLGPRRKSIPQAMAPAYLAGAFARERCEVMAYNEQHSGPLTDQALLGWPDMLVLTGLTNALDRMRQLAAYARSENPRVIVVAGGPAVRAVPRYASRFFDYACEGDVEEIRDVIAEAFGPGHVAEEMFPRLDLAHWMGRYGYVETSRNCNFHCSFCSLTADGYGYRKEPVEFIRRQILAMGKRRFLIFLDNNFYGNDRSFFVGRMEMLRELYEAGHVVGWGALVTNDFFLKDENLELARRAGCRALFSGIESFDAATLRRFRKLQNTAAPQVEMIRRCLDRGIGYCYGVVLDFTSRTLAELSAEMDFIVGNPEIPLPNYFSPVIPILQTPFFHECMRKNLLLPNAKLRDFDTTTLTLRPLDPVADVAAFLRDLPTLRRYRRRLPGRVLGFVRRYHRVLPLDGLRIVLGGMLMVSSPNLSSGRYRPWRPRGRTFVTTTEPLDALFRPAFRVARRYASYFEPTMVTDADGGLTEDLHDDLRERAPRPERVADRLVRGGLQGGPV